LRDRTLQFQSLFRYLVLSRLYVLLGPQRGSVSSLGVGTLRRIQEGESDLHSDRSIVGLETARHKKMLIIVERRQERILSGKIDAWPHGAVLTTGAKSERTGADVGDLDQGTVLRGLGCKIVFLFHLRQLGNRLGHSLDRNRRQTG
jgi:hypothetical protein